MKKVLSVVAVSAFVLTAGSAFAGGPGKRQMQMPAGCGEECQAQIDALNASQAQQNEMLAAQAAEIEALKNRGDEYNPWYVRGAFKFGWGHQRLPDGNAWGRGYDSAAVDTDTLFGGQFAIGKMFDAGFGDFRIELEYAYQGGDLDYKSYSNSAKNRALLGMDAAGRAAALRASGESWFRDFEGDVGLHTVMINGYYDMPFTDFFGAYVTVGVGYGRYKLDAGLVRDVTQANWGGGGWNAVDGWFDGPGANEWWGNDYNYVNGSRDVFAYKAGVGMSFYFTDSLAMDMGWEFLGTSSATINDVDVTAIHSHNIVTSLRFMF